MQVTDAKSAAKILTEGAFTKSLRLIMARTGEIPQYILSFFSCTITSANSKEQDTGFDTCCQGLDPKH